MNAPECRHPNRTETRMRPTVEILLLGPTLVAAARAVGAYGTMWHCPDCDEYGRGVNRDDPPA